MIPRDFQFAFPQALYVVFGLVVLFLIGFLSLKYSKKTRGILADDNLLAKVTLLPDPFYRTLKWILFSLAWILAVFALMQPQGNERAVHARQAVTPISQTPIDIYLLIDTSQSMGVKDTRNQVSRLDFAKAISDQLAKLIKQDPVALMTFTNRLYPISPLTFDKAFIRLMLREVNLNEGDTYGTNFLAPLEELNKNELTLYPKQPKAIILLSDGGDNAIEDGTEPEKQERLKQLSSIAKSIHAPIFSVSVGSETGGAVPDIQKQIIVKRIDAPLQLLSKESGGEFIIATSYTPEQVAIELVQALDKYRLSYAVQGISTLSEKGRFNDYFQIPLLLAFLMLLIAALIPNVRHITIWLCFIGVSLQLTAEDPGKKLYDAKNYSAAASWYEGELSEKDPQWLKDKLFYNLATSYLADNKLQEALMTLEMISQDAYHYPIFRKRIAHNLELAKIAAGPLKQFVETFTNAKTTDQTPTEAKDLLVATFEKEVAPVLYLENLIYMLGLVDWFKVQGQKPPFDPLKYAQKFYDIVLQFEQEEFKAGRCQCVPWNQAIPLFSEGLAALQRNETIIPFIQWIKALKILKNPPSDTHTQKQAQAAKQDLQELQNMQTQDRETKPKKIPTGSGILW